LSGGKNEVILKLLQWAHDYLAQQAATAPEAGID
jgi:hypothetical protein